MSGFLLDTNVLSEFSRRGDPNPSVKQWLEAADSGSLYASVLTLAEIRFGVELLPPGRRRSQSEQWLDRDLPSWFANRVPSVDRSIANRWGVLRAQAQAKGRPLSVIDGLLAATALQQGLTMVSRNVSDFSVLGLTVVNPWGLTGGPH
jgi:predicted nucleic acid-binding protein